VLVLEFWVRDRARVKVTAMVKDIRGTERLGTKRLGKPLNYGSISHYLEFY